MGAYYDEIEIEDMAWDEEKGVYHYPCPCGDRFEISRAQLANYEDIATCPSCSLMIRVVYDPLDFEDDADDDDGVLYAESESDSQTNSDDVSSPDNAKDEKSTLDCKTLAEAVDKLNLSECASEESQGTDATGKASPSVTVVGA
ncbi:zf-CSL-domain-containing protein [Fomitiporia mediterranea MF3/22]|uniref:zf-CSL-domain-containing protein n=1 Tax=Fomitiporia mediterranea (strain MF3/22) TaxID=694068 RepID=UPI0004408C34|nr:zf-CSL-domain-containing protein [Fomitiporia mediterranea MF3/22]EJD00448.1 zf-CSL-domain-containing protein [Fomitiporia mediterranea MF3/22]